MAQSMFDGLRWPHTRLIARYWSKFSVRTTGGMMAAIVILLVGLIILQIIVAPVDAALMQAKAAGHSEQEMLSQIDEIAKQDLLVKVVNFVRGDEAETSYLLTKRPALVSATLLLYLIFFPFIACAAAYNQTAGDIGSRGLRYLLLRTERPNVFFGRFLGTVKFFAIVSAILFLFIFLYMGLKFTIYGWGEIGLWLLEGYIACMLLSLPYIAMCALISALNNSSIASLALCLIAVGVPVLGAKWLNVQLQGDVDWLDRVVPWGWKYELVSRNFVTRLIAAGVMLGMTAFFLVLGMRFFSKRDL